MTKKKTTKTTSPRDEYEKENAPYLLEGSKIVRNYELLRGTPVDNNQILDYIDCNDADEAKRIRGWLWNAFAGGRNFEKAKSPKVAEGAPEVIAAASFAVNAHREVTEGPDQGMVLISKQTFDELKAAVEKTGMTLDEATMYARKASAGVR